MDQQLLLLIYYVEPKILDTNGSGTVWAPAEIEKKAGRTGAD